MKTLLYCVILLACGALGCTKKTDAAENASTGNQPGATPHTPSNEDDASHTLADTSTGSTVTVKGPRPLRVQPPAVDQGVDAGEPGSGPTLVEWVSSMPKQGYSHLAEVVIDYVPGDLPGEGLQLGHPVKFLDVKQVFLENPSGLPMVKGGPFILGNCTAEGLCGYDTSSPAYYSWGRVLIALSEDCWKSPEETVQRVLWTLPIEGDIIYGFHGEENSWADVEATIKQALSESGPLEPYNLACQPPTNADISAPDAKNASQDPNQTDDAY
jgi:hypothetical protein